MTQPHSDDYRYINVVSPTRNEPDQAPVSIIICQSFRGPGRKSADATITLHMRTTITATDAQIIEDTLLARLERKCRLQASVHVFT